MVIGYFFDSHQALQAAFYKHAYGATRYPMGDNVEVNHGWLTITVNNVEHRYYFVDKDGSFKQKIMGIQFQAVLIDMIDCQSDHKAYIMSRFRPR